MIKTFLEEEWKDIIFDEEISTRIKFKISNYGRIVKCHQDGKETLVKGSCINGYRTLPIRKKTGTSTSRYIHKLVAEHFLERKEGDQYVIHLNYNKLDNCVSNLKWATKEEKERHQFSNPKPRKITRNITSAKLTETQVKLIKRKINDPNRKTRMKMIAKQFGVSEMQLYRIKSGENWGHVSER